MYEMCSKFSDASGKNKYKDESKGIVEKHWKILILSVMRLALSVAYLIHLPSQLVVRADGSLTNKYLPRKRMKFLGVKEIISMAICNDRLAAIIDLISTLGLTLALVLYHNKEKINKGSGHSQNKDYNILRLDLSIFSLMIFNLLFSAADLINNISKSAVHTYLIFDYINIYDAILFTITAVTINGFHMFLWLGVLDFFNKCVLYREM